MTTADRIKQLNDLEQDVVQLVKSAGTAIKALAPTSPPSTEALTATDQSVEQQKQTFSAATTEYFKRLYSLDVGLRTQIRALEEAEIISTEAAGRDQPKITTSGKSTGLLGEPSSVTRPAAINRSNVSGGGLGNLDVGWLNSRNDYVGKNMEAALLKEASEFLAGLESQESQQAPRKGKLAERPLVSDALLSSRIVSVKKSRLTMPTWKMSGVGGVENLAWASQARQGTDGDPHVPNQQTVSTLRPSSPQWSIATVKSLDISSHIPKIAVAMDAEDSPWGDVPSRSSSGANLNKSADTEGQDSKPQSTPNLNSPTSAAPKSPAGRGPRTPRRVGAQATRLEAVDDSLGPLGPLGENATAPEPEQPPIPPSKEQSLPLRNARTQASQSPMSRSMMDSVNLGDTDGSTSSLRRYAQGQPSPAGPEGTRRQNQPSTSSKAYRQPEFAVSRRYRDFLWLYNTLHNNNPGVVVPPPPEKQAVGRFDSNFVESRRSALEKMLSKTAAHPILQHDGDLKIFLESDAFNMDVKHREHKEPGLGESKGMFSAIGLGGSGGGKFIEHDDWFHDRRIYLDALEIQLKALLKAIDTVVQQRKALAEAAGDFSASLHALSTVELSISLSVPLEGLSDLQLRIRELYERQAQQDVLTLGITVDEYIRLIGSIKMAFNQRQKSFHAWHSAEAELSKRRATQDKVLKSGKTQQDRLNQLQADVGEGERRSHQARLLFEDMGRLMRGELERFEREKVEDFKSGVETFLEGAIEAQKELIELWETFLMQFDADEDGEPFFKPPAVSPAPLKQQDDQQSTEQHSPEPSTEEGGTTQEAAATATIEQEE
ncbi:vacuolar protein sorting-associated protein vps5 [Physcia stellaris]|nr:vacuolar protein sorting-associated protein vps5 [Physcia stellaris]